METKLLVNNIAKLNHYLYMMMLQGRISQDLYSEIKNKYIHNVAIAARNNNTYQIESLMKQCELYMVNKNNNLQLPDETLGTLAGLFDNITSSLDKVPTKVVG